MAGGLPHPVLFHNLTGFTEVPFFGQFSHVFYTWLVMIGLFIVAFMVRSRIQRIPGGLQNVFEVIIDGLEDFTVDTMGEKNGRAIYPMIISIFMFILCMNVLGLVPGCDAPTANVNTNAAMALFVFVYYNAIGLSKWGIGYIGHFTGPMPALIPLMLPLEIISHVARPLSLTLRLFGNIRGEELVLILFFILAPLVGTIPIYFLFLLAKCLQAFIFFMLTMIYLKGAMEHAH